MKILLQLLFLLAGFVLSAQNHSRQILQNFDVYQKATPVEKLYLHTNREAITLGDTLWFSIYLVNGKTHVPGVTTEMIYAELISPLDEVLVSLPIEADSLGRAFGEIALADTMDAGNYVLRAYTNYQRNFAQDYFFHKKVRVLPRLSSQKEQQVADERPPTLNFQIFPEGGELLSNLNNIVAFKVTDEKGLPVEVKGQVVDDANQVVTDFETSHDGMGKFLLKPQLGTRYSCTYSFGDIPFSTPLPSIQEEGFLLNARQTSSKVYFTVRAQGVSVKETFLMIHQRGQVIQVVEAKPNDQYLYAALDKSLLPEGILHATFFDKNRKARLERLVFVDHQDVSNSLLDVSISDTVVSKRAKVSMSFQMTEENHTGFFSTAIIPASVYEPSSHDIRSYLLLTSDLKGYIHDPAQYMDTLNPKRLENIDLLMMTHGWRRFEWESIQNGVLPEINYFVQVGFTIEGQVMGYVNRRRKVQTDMYLSFLQKPDFVMEATSNEEGVFWFDGLKIKDSLNAFVKTRAALSKKRAKGKANANTYVKIIDRESPDIEFNGPPLTVQNEQGIVNRGEELFDIASAYDSDVVILDEISIEEKADPYQDIFKQSIKLYGQPDSRVMVDSLNSIQQYTNVFDMIRGKVPGVLVEGINPNYSVTVRNAEAALVFDGVPVDAQFLINIQPTDILYIDFIRGLDAAVFAPGAQGAIAVYSRSGQGLPVPDEDPLGFAAFPVYGFFAPRQFYMPNYDQPTEAEKVKPDYRSTLYWNPDIRVSQGKTSVDFFTSDEAGEFHVIIEGITLDGQLITQKSKFKVK